jgi:hypothetical protein
VLQYAHHTAKERVVVLPRVPEDGTLEVVIHADASGGAPAEASVRPTTGWAVTVQGHLIAWSSQKQKRVARSTVRAECLAVEHAIDYILSIAPFLRSIWQRVRISVGTDSANLMALMKQYHPNCAERRLIEVIKRIQGKAAVIPTMALRDIINDEKVALFKVPTADNVADAFTKCMDVKAIAARLKPQPQQIFSMEDAHREDVYEPADLDTDSNWSEGSEGA